MGFIYVKPTVVDLGVLHDVVVIYPKQARNKRQRNTSLDRWGRPVGSHADVADWVARPIVGRPTPVVGSSAVGFRGFPASVVGE